MTIVLYITVVFPATKFCNALNMFFKSKIFSNVLSLNSNLISFQGGKSEVTIVGAGSKSLIERTTLIIIRDSTDYKNFVSALVYKPVSNGTLYYNIIAKNILNIVGANSSTLAISGCAGDSTNVQMFIM